MHRSRLWLVKLGKTLELALAGNTSHLRSACEQPIWRQEPPQAHPPSVCPAALLAGLFAGLGAGPRSRRPAKLLSLQAHAAKQTLCTNFFILFYKHKPPFLSLFKGTKPPAKRRPPTKHLHGALNAGVLFPHA